MVAEQCRWFHYCHFYLRVTPIGVASLIATALLKASDISSVFRSAGMYVLAHSIGIFFHMSLTPLAYFITTRKNPLRFLSACLRPWITVFAPPSTYVFNISLTAATLENT